MTKQPDKQNEKSINEPTSESAIDNSDYQELQQQLTAMETNWKRALADYQNLQKRTSQQQQLLSQMACLSLVERLLPVIDHLELAALHLDDAGLSMIVKQFTEALQAEGVDRVEALKKPFDPLIMEATEQVPGEKDMVIEVVSAGYRIGDRIIRPAKVKVGKGEN